jgi:hypothetical protein
MQNPKTSLAPDARKLPSPRMHYQRRNRERGFGPNTNTNTNSSVARAASSVARAAMQPTPIARYLSAKYLSAASLRDPSHPSTCVPLALYETNRNESFTLPARPARI